ncbi:MAG: T9SS type A sorting domain-containing protein, partial [Bacteroidia bacterium]
QRSVQPIAQLHTHAQPRSVVQSHVLDQLSALNKGESPLNLRHSNSISTQALDTLVVGFVPNDTVIITGNWTHTGPIFVLGNGVLIFDHANVIDTGDVYVFGSGQLLADSSSLFFPQAYFYERFMLVVQNGFVRINNSSFNYSGLSHSLTVAQNGRVEWNNVHQNDWTTCGLGNQGSIQINGCNLSGEYILNDSSSSVFTHADSIILWHQLPETALINYSFPQGDTVYNYQFNNTISGVSGLNYDVTADSCHTVWWALMPVNGSDVTISNSDIRLIGAWFQDGDVANVYGIFNNSNYANYVTPLTDRNLHLINTSVETWSMYVFDSSMVTIDSCQLGEVGAQQRGLINGSDFILDGSGGYYWSTDSALVFGINSICYTTCRSEKSSLFVLAYSWLPFLYPSAIGNSTLICVQNNLPLDPIPFDAGVAWMANMEQPDTASVNSIFPIVGSAWIDQGPLGNPVDFANYSLYYQFPSQSATWFPIVVDSLNEIRHASLGNWNTNGLQAGTYVLKQVLKNNYGDSVEGFKVIELLPNPMGMQVFDNYASLHVFPNPSAGVFQIVTENSITPQTIYVRDMQGRLLITQRTSGTPIQTLDLSLFDSGVYWLEVCGENGSQFMRLVKE